MSWSIVKSGDLFSFVTSGSRGWAKFYSDAGPVFLRMGNLDHDSISLDLQDIQRVRPPGDTEGTRTRVQPMDILISITADVGMIGIIPDNFEEAYINQHVSLARPRPTVHPQYLAWYLSSPTAQRQFRELQRGATKVGLGLDDIRAVDVPLPLIQEQRRIVAEIEKQFTRLDVGVAALLRVQANLKRYRAAVLKAAFEGRLVPSQAELTRNGNRDESNESGEALLARIHIDRRQNWQGRGKYKEPDSPDSSNRCPIPNGWLWTNLDTATLSGPQNGVYLPHELYGHGHPILRIDDYQDGWVRGVEELKKVAADKGTADKYRLLPGDIVINRVNSMTHLGKCLVVRDTHMGALFESNMMRLHLSAYVNPRYVEFYLRSQDGRTRLTRGAKWAVNQASINQEDIKQTPLPLPSPAEQTRIVAEIERRLSVVEEMESLVTVNLQRAARLRQSILQKAFTGDLV